MAFLYKALRPDDFLYIIQVRKAGFFRRQPTPRDYATSIQICIMQCSQKQQPDRATHDAGRATMFIGVDKTRSCIVRIPRFGRVLSLQSAISWRPYAHYTVDLVNKRRINRPYTSSGADIMKIITNRSTVGPLTTPAAVYTPTKA